MSAMNENSSLNKTMATEVATASNEMAATPDTGVSKTIKRFCLYELHEYMDLHPTKEVRMQEGKDREALREICVRFSRHMNRVYSGGTTKFIKIMSAEEAQKYVQDTIDEEKQRYPGDMEYINKAISMYNEAYPEAPHTFDV